MPDLSGFEAQKAQSHPQIFAVSVFLSIAIFRAESVSRSPFAGHFVFGTTRVTVGGPRNPL